MSWIRNPGRIAGLVYLSMVFTGPFSLMYVPNKLFVHGNAARLMLNAVPYLALSFTGILLPGSEARVWNVLTPLTFGEIAVMLWLVVRGTSGATPFNAPAVPTAAAQ